MPVRDWLIAVCVAALLAGSLLVIGSKPSPRPPPPFPSCFEENRLDSLTVSFVVMGPTGPFACMGGNERDHRLLCLTMKPCQ